MTDRRYSVRLSDLWAARGECQYELDDTILLKQGRQIRPAPHFKLIVAREESEGKFMRGYRSQYPSLEVASHAGPLALIDGTPTLDDITLAARIVGRYSQGREAPSIELAYRSPEGIVTPLRVRPQGVDEMPEVWLI